MSNTSLQHWWGAFSPDLGCIHHWQLGPLDVKIRRCSQEWAVAQKTHVERVDENHWYKEELDTDNGFFDGGYLVDRHLVTREAESLQIKPALADRPVVSRPLYPLHIHPQECLSIFVGSPLWFQVQLDPAGRRLLDIPILRPSDTWFGPSTRKGELCYSSRTHARLSHDELPVPSLRATTVINIQNDSDEPIVVDKLSLPVIYLSLFADNEGRIWSDSLMVSCEKGSDQVKVEIQLGPPIYCIEAIRLNTPRKNAPHSIFQALSGLFG